MSLEGYYESAMKFERQASRFQDSSSFKKKQVRWSSSWSGLAS